MKTILSEDNSRPFVPSSPSNGLETEKEGWIAENPGDNLYGDVHYYNYGSQPLNYKIYPNTRFASEYGYESFPSLNTLLPIANASDLTYPLSSLFEFRQHHGNGNKEIEDMIKTYFKLPAHGHAERMEDLIYLSQIIQAMAIKTETEFYLRNRQINSKGEGFTMGALYWQLNDIWQAPTWSSIEFGGKWKMLHYYAKKMFQNLLVSPYENDGQLMVSIVRDDLSGTLEFDLFVKLFKWSSFDPVKTVSIKVSTNQSTSNLVYQQKISDLLNMTKCKSRNECMIQVEISNLKLNLYADNFLFLEPLKNAVGLTKPNLKILEITKVAKPHNSFLKIKLQADHIAPFVWFDLKFNSKITGTFSENGFLMLNNTKLIQFTPDHNNLTVKDLIADLTVKSLTDVVS